MQYLINSFSNLFTRKNKVTKCTPDEDYLYDYIKEKSLTGPKGYYCYSDPKKNIHYSMCTVVPNDKFYDYIKEKSVTGPKGYYSYSDPKHNLHFSTQKC